MSRDLLVQNNGLLNWKSYISFEKMRNASCQQGEASKVKKSGSERKSEQEHKQQNLMWTHATYSFFP